MLLWILVSKAHKPTEAKRQNICHWWVQLSLVGALIHCCLPLENTFGFHSEVVSTHFLCENWLPEAIPTPEFHLVKKDESTAFQLTQTVIQTAETGHFYPKKILPCEFWSSSENSTFGSIYLSVWVCVKPGERVVFSCFLNIPIPEVFDWSGVLSDRKLSVQMGTRGTLSRPVNHNHPPTHPYTHTHMHSHWAAYTLHRPAFSLRENNHKNI